jgi:ATP-binding cassette subfamily B protein
MSHTNKSPLTRLIGLLRVEKSDIVVLSVYTTAVVLLTLAVPLAMQALVNTVAAGLFEQPLVVLTLLVFVGLAIAGFLQLLQIGIVEKTAMELVHRLVRVKAPALRDEYAPELVNRFFDVLTIQKSLNKLLLDGLTAVVQATVALLVLGFYNPMMLIVGLLLIVSFAASLVFLGYRGVRTSIDESHEKYHVVDWLQDVARCHSTLKLHGEANFAAKHADQTIGKYLDAREGHFRVVRRQHAGYFFFAAVSTAGSTAMA